MFLRGRKANTFFFRGKFRPVLQVDHETAGNRHLDHVLCGKIVHDNLGTYTIILAIQNVSRCIAKIKKAKNVSVNNCGNDRCYAEIRKSSSRSVQADRKRVCSNLLKKKYSH